MAWEAPVQILPGQTAGSDFSAGNGYNNTGQFLITKFSGDSAHVPCAAVTDKPSGISQGNPKSGGALPVTVLGVSKVLVGVGGLVAGDSFGPDAQGKAVVKNQTSTGAQYGQWVLGTVVEGAAAGALATVLVGTPYVVH